MSLNEREMEGIPKKQSSNFEWALFFGVWGYVLIALPALVMSIMKARDKKEIIHNQVFEVATIDGIEEKYHSDFSKYHLPFPDSLKWSEKLFYNK